MPSGTQHVKQAEHNVQFLNSFYKTHQYNDWSITVAFYIAVHIVENAIFSTQTLKYRGQEIKISHCDELPREASRKNIPPPNNFSWAAFSHHTARKIIVEENFKEIADGYMLLYRKSRSARYENFHISDSDSDLIVKVVLSKTIDWSNEKFSTKFKLSLN